MHDKRRTAGSSIRPGRPGLAKVLGDLEAAVMEQVWKLAPRAVSARDVERTVGRRRDLQYITIVTVMNNLWQKGLLTREKEGRAYLYQPSLSRDQFVREVTRDAFSGLLALGADQAVTAFVDALADAAPEELDRLKTELAARRRRTGSKDR